MKLHNVIEKAPRGNNPKAGSDGKLATHQIRAERRYGRLNSDPMAMSAHPDHLGAYPRRVLLAATGLSPQIVTETLYVLAVERGRIPTEVRLVTTQRGADKARDALLADDTGWFHRLREDYGLPPIAFDAEKIHVVTGPDGSPLDDILSDADNVAIADFITEQVRAITADPESSLHVTIAGGRKTMGFYVGYALSLFGRKQDSLSHVLVSPPFESLPDFFYPTPRRAIIYDHSGHSIDAKEAGVYLGEIPFVRLRDGLPTRLLEGGTRFSEAVAEAQKALPPLELRLDPATRTVVAGGRAFILEPMQFALYWMMADNCKAKRGGIGRYDEAIAKDLLGYYGRVRNPNSGIYEKSEKAYRDFSEANFDQTKAKLNRAIKRALEERWAAPYLIAKLGSIAGSRLHHFGLSLPPAAITIGPASLPSEQATANHAHIPSVKPARTRNSP
jgi:CRISPR-associated protein (TIGR02584 family)